MYYQLLTNHIPGTIASFGSKNGKKKPVVQEKAAKKAVRRSTRNREPSPTPQNGNSEGWWKLRSLQLQLPSSFIRVKKNTDKKSCEEIAHKQ